MPAVDLSRLLRSYPPPLGQPFRLPTSSTAPQPQFFIFSRYQKGALIGTQGSIGLIGRFLLPYAVHEANEERCDPVFKIVVSLMGLKEREPAFLRSQI